MGLQWFGKCLYQSETVLSDFDGERKCQGGEVGGQGVVEDGAENGNTETSTNSSKEATKSCDSGNILGLNSALTSDHKSLNTKTTSSTKDDKISDLSATGRISVPSSQKTTTDDNEGSTNPEEFTNTSSLATQQSRPDTAENKTEHNREKLETTGCSTVTANDLEVDWGKVDGTTEEAHTEEELSDEKSDGITLYEQVTWNDRRLGLPFLDTDEDNNKGGTNAEESNDNWRVPWILVTTPC